MCAHMAHSMPSRYIVAVQYIYPRRLSAKLLTQRPLYRRSRCCNSEPYCAQVPTVPTRSSATTLLQRSRGCEWLCCTAATVQPGGLAVSAYARRRSIQQTSACHMWTESVNAHDLDQWPSHTQNTMRSKRSNPGHDPLPHHQPLGNNPQGGMGGKKQNKLVDEAKCT